MGLERQTEEENVDLWMKNIVKESGKGMKIYISAKICMKRFLASLTDPSSVSTWRESKLLAAACLLVSSKVAAGDNEPEEVKSLENKGDVTAHFTAKDLVKSAGSFGKTELLDCELLLLYRLGWDVFLGCWPE